MTGLPAVIVAVPAFAAAEASYGSLGHAELPGLVHIARLSPDLWSGPELTDLDRDLWRDLVRDLAPVMARRVEV